MNTKREIHGFDQAVVLLMFGLDRVFAHRVEGWRRTHKGYRVEILNGSRDMTKDVMAKIYPVGLPESDYVTCRFDKHHDEWTAYKGQISRDHSAKEIAGFAFDGTNATMDRTILECVIETRYDKPKLMEILSRDAIYDCVPA